MTVIPVTTLPLSLVFDRPDEEKWRVEEGKKETRRTTAVAAEEATNLEDVVGQVIGIKAVRIVLVVA